jgi:hypothetical protein
MILLVILLRHMYSFEGKFCPVQAGTTSGESSRIFQATVNRTPRLSQHGPLKPQEPHLHHKKEREREKRRPVQRSHCSATGQRTDLQDPQLPSHLARLMKHPPLSPRPSDLI